jgi:hypothetical protein
MDPKKLFSHALEHPLQVVGVALAAVLASPVVLLALTQLWPYLLAGGVVAVVSIDQGESNVKCSLAWVLDVSPWRDAVVQAALVFLSKKQVPRPAAAAESATSGEFQQLE